MKLHTLKSSAPRKSRKRVGRGTGNGHGRTCGRGDKGQMARSGAVRRPYFEGGQIPFFRRIPKKGFNCPSHKVYALINVGKLEELFDAGDEIDFEKLSGKGVVGKLGAGLKVLGDGEITKSLTVKAVKFSEAARSKIEAAGGTCEVI